MDNSFEKRNGSWKFLFSQETKDTDLGQSSVVEFRDKTLGLGVFALVLGEAKGVEKVQRN